MATRCSLAEANICMVVQETRKRTTHMTDSIIKSAVKGLFDGVNVSAGFYEALDAEVAGLLEDAARCADANDRKTGQQRDL